MYILMRSVEFVFAESSKGWVGCVRSNVFRDDRVLYFRDKCVQPHCWLTKNPYFQSVQSQIRQKELNDCLMHYEYTYSYYYTMVLFASYAYL